MKKIILSLVVAVFVLLGVSYFYLGMEERDAKGWFVNKEEVRGSALKANNLNYTFNYKQQKGVLQELNNSKKVQNLNPPQYTPNAIDSIMIYLFDSKEPLELVPASNDYTYFKVSTWKEPYYLQIMDPEDLQIILELAYDK